MPFGFAHCGSIHSSLLPSPLGAQGRGSGSGDRERGRDPGATPGAQGRGSGSCKKTHSSHSQEISYSPVPQEQSPPDPVPGMSNPPTPRLPLWPPSPRVDAEKFANEALPVPHQPLTVVPERRTQTANRRDGPKGAGFPKIEGAGHELAGKAFHGHVNIVLDERGRKAAISPDRVVLAICPTFTAQRLQTHAALGPRGILAPLAPRCHMSAVRYGFPAGCEAPLCGGGAGSAR